MRRGEIWWASLPDPRGPSPGFRWLVLVVQNNPFNESRIRTVVVAAVSSDVRLTEAPGNILLKQDESRLARASVINVSQILTVDKSFLTEQVSVLGTDIMARVDAGLNLVLGL